MAETTAAVDRATADIPITRSARDALERAVEAAARRNTTDATPVDVLRGVLESPGSLATDAMRALNVDPRQVAAQIPEDGQVSSLPLRQLVLNANREAQVLGHYQVDSVHLLLALLYSDSRATAAILQSAGLTLYDLRRHMQTGPKPQAPAGAGAGTVAARAQARPPDRTLRRRPWPSLRNVLGVSPIFIALIAITVAAGALLFFDLFPAADGIVTLAFVVGGWIVSVCLHEFAHALVAYLGGDRDVAVSGYLSLNPLRYTNVVMSIVFPVLALLLGGFALPGGAVFVNWTALRSRTWDSVVSLAGPVTNALLALLIGGVSALALRLEWVNTVNLPFFEALALLGFFEVFATVINLLPIPPLDGFGILRPWLPWSIRSMAAAVGMTGYVIVFFVLFYVPALSGPLVGAVSQVSTAVGIDPFLVDLGSAHMRFR